MHTLHILSPGFTTPNGAAFLFPLYIYRKYLEQAGIKFKLFKKVTPSLYACDILFVDSKFHKEQWIDNPSDVLKQFERFKHTIKKVYYCDTTDGSGWIQSEVLPIVDLYLKAQILKDREAYLEPIYGQRPFAAYYHKKYQVKDTDPLYSQPVKEKAHLHKIHISWNSGLADYSLYGPYSMMLYQKFPLRHLLRFPTVSTSPHNERYNAIHCRMGTNYSRDSVSWQRKRIKEILKGRIPTNKINRKAFIAELQQSKIAISPFGWGEITLKDFEVFLNGTILLKPDMDHMETWPDFYEKGKTYIAFNWDCTDLETTIENILNNYNTYQAVAKEGQNKYLSYITPEKGVPAFIGHVKQLLVTA